MLRCSSLSRNISCPASMIAPEIEFRSDSYAAQIGRACHYCLAGHVKGVPVDWHQAAEEFGVEVDDIAPLVAAGQKTWEEVAGDLSLIGVECELIGRIDGRELMGHPDAIVSEDLAGQDIVIFDWKSGRPGAAWEDQLTGYALLALKALEGKEIESIKAVAVWLRDGFYDVIEIDTDDIVELEDRLRTALQKGETYNPTAENCRFCPRKIECPARKALVQKSADELSTQIKMGDVLKPEQIAALKPRADMLEDALESYKDVLKETLQEHGPLPIGDGRELYLQRQQREKVDLEQGLPTLQREVGGFPVLLPALKISKTKLKKIIASQTERGHKGRRKKEVMEALREAGAVRSHEISFPRERRREQDE